MLYFSQRVSLHSPESGEEPKHAEPDLKVFALSFFGDADGFCPSQSLSTIVVIIIFMKALALLLEKENSTLSSMTDMADSAVFWKINTDTAAIMLRDKLIVEVQQATLIYQFQYMYKFDISISIYQFQVVPLKYLHCLLPLIEVKSRRPHEDMTLEQAKLSLHFSTL